MIKTKTIFAASASLILSQLLIPLATAAVLQDPITPIDSNPTTGPTDGQTHYTGEGYAIAILDSGVNKNHVALQNKVIDEICVGYATPVTDGSGTRLENLCPDPDNPTETRGNINIYHRANVATTCTPKLTAASAADDLCMHGTAVAAAAVMPTQSLTLPPDTVTTSGSATGAKIISVQVNAFTPATADKPAQLTTNHALTIAAMTYLLEKSNTFDLPLAAINYSAGGDMAAGDHATCRTANEASASNRGQYDTFKTLFDNFRAKNIAPIISNGNDGDPTQTDPVINMISFPACVQGAIAIGATDNSGIKIAQFSQNAPITSLLASGGDGSAGGNGSIWLPSGNNNDNFRGLSGTSFATPITAGAFAILRQKHPTATIDQLLRLLQHTGKLIPETRAGYATDPKPLIQLNRALAFNLADLPDEDIETAAIRTPNTGFTPHTCVNLCYNTPTGL